MRLAVFATERCANGSCAIDLSCLTDCLSVVYMYVATVSKPKIVRELLVMLL